MRHGLHQHDRRDSVTVECSDPAPPPSPKPVGIVGAPEPCRWVAATAVDGWDPAAYGNINASGYVFAQRADGAIVRQFPDGREETVFNRVCPDGSSGFTWVDTSVTVQDVIDDAIDRARGAVPSPTLDISPPPDVGGIVNLGMWLALQAQPPVTVRAEAGPHWAEATVTLASTRWDFGNGDEVVCEGAGVPIVDPDTPEQGPCGYTYRTSSPEDAPVPARRHRHVGGDLSILRRVGVGRIDRANGDGRLRRRRDPNHRHLQLTPTHRSAPPVQFSAE